MSDFESKVSSGSLTFKVYRGEGLSLLAFDLDQAAATDDFVGFTIEVKYPGSTDWAALGNRRTSRCKPDMSLPGAVFRHVWRRSR
jgi:hypothetical protein